MLHELAIVGKQIRIDVDPDKSIKCPQCASTEVVSIKEGQAINNKQPGLRFGQAAENYIELIDCLGCGRQFTPYEDPDIAKLVRNEEARIKAEEAKLKALDLKIAARLGAHKPIPWLFCLVYVVLGILFFVWHLTGLGISALVLAVILSTIAKPRGLPKNPEYLKTLEKKELLLEANKGGRLVSKVIGKVLLASVLLVMSITTFALFNEHQNAVADGFLMASLLFLYWLLL